MKNIMCLVTALVCLLMATYAHAAPAYCESYTALHMAMAQATGEDVEVAELIATVQCVDSSYAQAKAQADTDGRYGVVQIAGGWRPTTEAEDIAADLENVTFIESSSWGVVLVNGVWEPIQ